MYVYMFVRMYVSKCECLYACVHVCMYMYVCICVYMLHVFSYRPSVSDLLVPPTGHTGPGTAASIPLRPVGSSQTCPARHLKQAPLLQRSPSLSPPPFMDIVGNIYW